MLFKVSVFFALIVTVVAGVTLLPGFLNTITNNDQIKTMVRQPDETFRYFSLCKHDVQDVDRCYNAYSAAVEIAESKDCSPEGIALKRKFKGLVEHGSASVIDGEIKKECASY
ncbi:hypothetical protein [Huaxiibacter chinensis]|uniref:hypothetical protein n=1 Tax=Huaxiibacter chinensis TaxID=2899785 RepID=UPI003D312AB1